MYKVKGHCFFDSSYYSCILHLILKVTVFIFELQSLIEFQRYSTNVTDATTVVSIKI